MGGGAERLALLPTILLTAARYRGGVSTRKAWGPASHLGTETSGPRR